MRTGASCKTPCSTKNDQTPTGRQVAQGRLERHCVATYLGMTLVEATYELQSPLDQEQLRNLGNFANTYGLRRFRIDEHKNQLSFEYDASRLRETELVHVLRHARIPVLRKVN